MNQFATQRISKVIQTEATTPAIEDFLLTHAPFENLYLDNHKSITEKKFLQNFLLNNPEEHKFIMVQGGNGSGKSHLIRWLKEKYINNVDEQREAVLLISRAHNTLQDALSQLLEAEIFPEEIRNNELKHIKNSKSNITGEELKKTINFNFTLEIDSDDGKPDLILEPRYRKWLSTYLKDNYIMSQFLMSENGPLSRIRSKIEVTKENAINMSEDPMFLPNDFDITIQQISSKLKIAEGRASDFTIRLAEKLADKRTGLKIRQSVADYLNTKVSNVIQRSIKLQTSDFKKLFSSLRKILKQQNMNLTLFVEDINSFTGIDEALMEVLLTNHNAEGNNDYCRIISVVGSTEKFYNDRLNASIKERIKTNIYIREKSVLGTKDQLGKFAARYINAINLSDTQIESWIANGASDEEIPVVQSQYAFSKVNCDGLVLSIFPFNQTALWNLYESLPMDKRTPRIFLKSVIAHVLKIWFTNSEGFLSSEDNFNNPDINMPRWKNQLYNQKNKEIDETNTVERGILLRLWGDGTAEEKSGTLGGLTSEIFKAFKVYANITGEPKPLTTIQAQKEPNESKVIPDEIVSKVQKNSKLIEIEKDLDNWAYNKDLKNNRLKNHAELRNHLINFIISSINWELEGIPQLLVMGYISKNTVYIEGQLSNIGEGFILKRSDESVLLLTALASWRHLGENTWNFEGSSDYLVTALAWIERYKKAIISVCTAPKGRVEWNLPLWNVAALYCIKTLFGGLDITKSSEEITLDLIGTKPDFTIQSIHSESWDTLQSIILRNDDYKMKLINETLAYFSKSIGSAVPGNTNYIFVDYLEILKQVKKLKSLQWELNGICPNDVENINNTFYYACNLINIFVKSISKIVEDENNRAEDYLLYFRNAFDSNFSEENVEASLLSMKEFLRFLSEELNLSYNEDDYKIIKPSNSASKLIISLNRIEKIRNNEGIIERLMRIAKNPFDEIVKYYKCFISFNKLLNDKNEIFSSSVDTQSKSAIDAYQSKINQEISKMMCQIEAIGGCANDDN